MGRKGNKGSNWARCWAKGKGMSAEGHHAINKSDLYLVDVLRAYPAEDGSIFVKRSGAARDLDIVSAEGMSARLSHGNAESHRRPGKWLSMLAASVAEAGRTARYAADHIDLTGLPAFAESATEEVLEACALLDTTKKLESSAEQRAAAVRTLLTFAADEEAEVGLTRLALMSAKLYVGATQTLQAGRATACFDHCSAPIFSCRRRQAAACLRYRLPWSTELAKTLEHLPAEVRSFVQNPASDEALLAALRAAYGQGGGSLAPYAADPLGGGAAPPAPLAAAVRDPLGGCAPVGPSLFGASKRPASPLFAAAEPAPKRGKLTLRPPAGKAKAAPAKPAAPAWPAPEFLRWCTRFEAAEAAGCSEHEAHLLAEGVPTHLKLADGAPLEQCEAEPQGGNRETSNP